MQSIQKQAILLYRKENLDLQVSVHAAQATSWKLMRKHSHHKIHLLAVVLSTTLYHMLLFWLVVCILRLFPLPVTAQKEVHPRKD